MSEFASAPYTAGQLNAIVKKLVELAGEDGPKKLLSGDLILKAAELLKRVTTKAVPAITRFVADDCFKVNTSKKSTVKIGYLGDDFKKHFLGKIEKDIPTATLTTHALVKDSLDAPILAELGNRAVTFLAHLWGLLTKQANGESGVLLANGYANIFYIQDVSGVTWAVYANWNAYYDGDWNVGAHPVDNPCGWGAGYLVVSR